MSAGVRFGYTNINGTLDTGNFNLGEQNDVNLAFKNLCKAVHCRSASISAPMRDWTAKDTSGFSVK